MFASSMEPLLILMRSLYNDYVCVVYMFCPFYRSPLSIGMLSYSNEKPLQ